MNRVGAELLKAVPGIIVGVAVWVIHDFVGPATMSHLVSFGWSFLPLWVGLVIWLITLMALAIRRLASRVATNQERLVQAEDLLVNIASRLDMDQWPALHEKLLMGLDPTRKAEKYQIFRDGRIVKEWTREEILALPYPEKVKLREAEPAMWAWYTLQLHIG